MNIILRAGCRMFQKCFYIAMPLLPYRNPKIAESIENVPEIIRNNNLKKPLIVTDKNLLKYTESICKNLEEYGFDYALFDEVKPNPTVESAENVLKKYNEEGCDCFIALGGGSPMDCAKAAGARAARPGKSLSDMSGILKVIKKTPFFVAVPTTAGTGSEATVTALVTDEKTGHKYTVNDFPLIPDYAVLDASLLESLPASLTASTGMDALTHAVEAYIGKSVTRETKKYCFEAVKLIFENIEKAYRGEAEAKGKMLYASHLAGKAFTRSYVGYIHSVSHSLSGEYNMPHGLTNAILLPFVLEKYGNSVYNKLSELGELVGIKGNTAEEKSKSFISEIKEMNKRMGIPEKIKGIQKEDIPKLSAYAAKEANPLYPVPVLMNRKELEEIYYGIME